MIPKSLPRKHRQQMSAQKSHGFLLKCCYSYRKQSCDCHLGWDLLIRVCISGLVNDSTGPVLCQLMVDIQSIWFKCGMKIHCNVQKLTFLQPSQPTRALHMSLVTAMTSCYTATIGCLKLQFWEKSGPEDLNGTAPRSLLPHVCCAAARPSKPLSHRGACFARANL